MQFRFPVLLFTLLLVAPFASPAQPDFGYLGVDFTHSRWPSPESVARDLRSSNEEIRRNALVAAGAPEALIQVERNYEAQGRHMPRQVELRYAALGADNTQQAL